jgi:hypothetical protein
VCGLDGLRKLLEAKDCGSASRAETRISSPETSRVMRNQLRVRADDSVSVANTPWRRPALRAREGVRIPLQRCGRTGSVCAGTTRRPSRR